MYYLLFLCGVALGALMTRFLMDYKSVHGSFRVDPYDDDNTGFYKVNISLTSKDDMLKKDYMILKKDNSQKLHLL